jgi:hypothetical protein
MSREARLARAELVPLRAKFYAMTKEERIKLLEEEERRERESASMHTPIEERDEFDAMREAMPDLNRLARYERRACRAEASASQFHRHQSKRYDG